MKNSGSPQQKNEIVQVDLSIGQCELLQSLIDAEIYEAEAHTSRFKENSLNALYDVFYAKTKPSPSETHAEVEKWVQNLELKGYQHG